MAYARTMDLQLALGRAISAEKKASDLTLDDMSHLTGLSDSTLKRIMSGRQDMRFSRLTAICTAFGIPVSQLLTRAEEIQARSKNTPRGGPQTVRGDGNVLIGGDAEGDVNVINVG